MTDRRRVLNVAVKVSIPLLADLVEKLRIRGKMSVSLIALSDDHIVGHIAFSPVKVSSESGSFELIALGPMGFAITSAERNWLTPRSGWSRGMQASRLCCEKMHWQAGEEQ
jgi:hypothetical protein